MKFLKSEQSRGLALQEYCIFLYREKDKTPGFSYGEYQKEPS